MERNTFIDKEKVKQDANLIKTYAGRMNKIFEDFTLTMNTVGSDEVFLGSASEALKEKFALLRTRFESYTRTVENFSNMILSAEQAVSQTEQSIQKDIGNLSA